MLFKLIRKNLKMMKEIYINITLKEMLDELVSVILYNQPKTLIFYYRREIEDNKYEYVEINEVDLLDSRFRTIDGDFSEFEWELEHSNIYKKSTII